MRALARFDCKFFLLVIEMKRKVFIATEPKKKFFFRFAISARAHPRKTCAYMKIIFFFHTYKYTKKTCSLACEYTQKIRTKPLWRCGLNTREFTLILEKGCFLYAYIVYFKTFFLWIINLCGKKALYLLCIVYASRPRRRDACAA